jgi:hypothetical protein
VSPHIITRLALDAFTSEELAQIRLAARALVASGADSGTLIFPGRPEPYRLGRTREGVTLDLATDEGAAAAAGLGPWLSP